MGANCILELVNFAVSCVPGTATTKSLLRNFVDRALPTYSESYGDDEWASDHVAERLVTGDVLAVRLDCVKEGKVGNEEENDWRDNTLGHAPCKHFLVEQKIVMTGRVQLRKSERISIAHVLNTPNGMSSYWHRFSVTYIYINYYYNYFKGPATC